MVDDRWAIETVNLAGFTARVAGMTRPFGTLRRFRSHGYERIEPDSGARPTSTSTVLCTAVGEGSRIEKPSP